MAESNKRKRVSEPENRNLKTSQAQLNRPMAPVSPEDEAQQNAIFQSLLQGIVTTEPMTGSGQTVQDEIKHNNQAQTAQAAQAALQQQVHHQQSQIPQAQDYPQPSHTQQYPDPQQQFDQSGMQQDYSQLGDNSQMPETSAPMSAQLPPPGGQQTQFATRNSLSGLSANDLGKPQVGSTQWHQQRKDNHKEVERRRREVINEGIENIQKLIPSTDKNKGQILQNTCRYIQELQATIKAFDNERHVFSVTQAELERRINHLKGESARDRQDKAKWMQRCREAGLEFDDYEEDIRMSMGPGDEHGQHHGHNHGQEGDEFMTEGDVKHHDGGHAGLA